VNADPHTVVSYITLSGEGLRILAAYEPENATDQGDEADFKAKESYYRRMFTAINQYYAQLIGCEFDPACKDLSRLSFAAFDAETFYRPDATPFQPVEMGVLNKEQRKEKKEAKRQQNKAKHVIGRIYKQQIIPFLKQDGVEYGPGTHNNYVMRVGYLLNKYGFELADAQAWAIQEFPEYAEAASVIGYCYSRTEEHGEWEERVKDALSGAASYQKLPRATRVDIYNFLMKKVDVHFNVLVGAPEMRWKNPEYEGIASKHSINRREWTRDLDGMVKSLLWMMEEECQLDGTVDKVFQVISSDRIPEYDPLVDYLHKLPAWNPETDPDYLGELASTVKILDTDPQAQDLWRRCLKKWFVWMIIGWIRPNEVNQTILYLIGAQGTYKSTWMRNIMPPQLREYFKIKQDSGSMRTDDVINMSRFGLILHEESDVMNARENNTLKAMTTALYSDERAPYARTPSRRINGASLCATGNNENFLTNEQGTRRALVFRVASILSPLDHPFNYEGIYSQAYYLAQNGFQYYFDPEEQAELERHNLQFETANMEEDSVALWLRIAESWETPRWFRASQIAELLSQRSHCHAKYDANKIGKIMVRLGFPVSYRGGKIGYKAMVRDYDEAVRYQKELAVTKDSPSETEKALKEEVVKDAQEAPEQVQDMFSRILGERDDDPF
jgi:hypothetical protein